MRKIVKNLNFFATEFIYIVFLIFLSAIPRFAGLDYSHFYGDETKTLYIDKTVPALDFFINQRKGPVQFFVVWVVEKISGGFSEFWVRLPFAVAGLLSVLFFYFFVKNIYGRNPAIFASLLYSLSGFSVAFSRTAQYQSFLLLLGFSSMYFFDRYVSSKRNFWGLLSVVSFSLLFLTHYDSIFILIPLVLLYGEKIVKDSELRGKAFKSIILPILLVCGLFYIPYILKGSFTVDTVNYLGKRLSGKEFLPNNSLYTMEVYNPGLVFNMLMSISVLVGLFSGDVRKKKLFIWFFLIFALFQFVFQNPGTHILNYLIPVYILFGLGSSELIAKFEKHRSLALLGIFLPLIFLYIVSLFVFVPALKFGYPWQNAKLGVLNFHRPLNKYQLFLYGFPYNVGWDKVADYMYSLKGVRGYFTNDNDSLGAYYLMKYPQTPPGTNFLPQYYIHFTNPQELRDRSGFISTYNNYYDNINEIFVDGVKTCEIYRSKGFLFNGTPDYPGN